jgi:hypothetical protein
LRQNGGKEKLNSIKTKVVETWWNALTYDECRRAKNQLAYRFKKMKMFIGDERKWLKFTKYPLNIWADWKVYVVPFEYMANEKVYFVPFEYMAEKKVYKVPFEYMADKKVYEVPFEYMA